MKRQRKICGPNRPAKLPSPVIHLETVRSFVHNYCQGFSWFKKADGAIRARNLPNLLKLSDQVNDELICSATGDETAQTEYGSAASFHAASQFVALVGKYQYPPGIMSHDPDARALEDFLKAERRNRRLNLVFSEHLRRGTDRHWSVPMVRRFFCRVLGRTPFFERIFDQCDFSGGASTQHTGSVTHLAAKLGGETIQSSKTAFEFFVYAVLRNHHYRIQLQDSKTYEFNGEKISYTCYDDEYCRARLWELYEETVYNKVAVVAKNAKSSRTIAKEPPGNNLVQKGIDLELRHLLRTIVGIDLRYQEPNQLLARLGASQWDTLDPHVTLDVKGASYSMLREAIRSVSPPRWYKLLDQTRSQNYMLPTGEIRPYEMFCSMGNGFCFPLETLMFAAICDTAYRHARMKPDYRCYGDDIVVRRSVALVVIECLNAFGFQVNVQKSYVHGPFRESCGANSYGGREVTPGYYKDPITCQSELYAQHNSLKDWPEVQATLRSFGAPHVVPDVPHYRWVSNQAAVVPLDVAMTSNNVFWSRAYQSWQANALLTSPIADKNWQKGFNGSSVEGMILTAVLRGSRTSEEPFHLRHSTKTKVVKLSKHEKVHACEKQPDGPYAHVAQWALRQSSRYHHTNSALRRQVLFQPA